MKMVDRKPQKWTRNIKKVDRKFIMTPKMTFKVTPK